MSEQIPTEDEMRLTVKPRALTYSLPEYWIAVGGKGPLGSQWEDKPHRLVYDLLAANLRANDELTSLRASQAETEGKLTRASLTIRQLEGDLAASVASQAALVEREKVLVETIENLLAMPLAHVNADYINQSNMELRRLARQRIKPLAQSQERTSV